MYVRLEAKHWVFAQKDYRDGSARPSSYNEHEISHADQQEWWDKLREYIDKYDVRFLVGDFNMSLTQVVPQLRRRGLKIDTCSWYPWLHMEQECGGSCLGMDSCAIFYIGGDVECEMQWNFNRIRNIRKAAVHPCRGPQSRPNRLDAYSGDNKPGMLWNRYKSMKHEKPNDRT